jgi:hypothetical protein
MACASLERPESTVNSFMALRQGRNAIERVTGPLLLKTGTSPILGAVLTRFGVIDSHHPSHQVSRAIPGIL